MACGFCYYFTTECKPSGRERTDPTDNCRHFRFFNPFDDECGVCHVHVQLIAEKTQRKYIMNSTCAKHGYTVCLDCCERCNENDCPKRNDDDDSD